MKLDLLIIAAMLAFGVALWAGAKVFLDEPPPSPAKLQCICPECP